MNWSLTSPSYVHESWYPMFLLAIGMSLLVLWAAVVLDTIRGTRRPRATLALFPAVLGVLIATTPYGIAIWGGLTLALVSTPGVPFLAVGLPVALLATLSLFFYWNQLIGPTVRRVVRNQRAGR